MKRTFWAAGAAIALGLAACDLGDRTRPEPTPSPTATPAPGTNWQPLGSPGPGGVAALQFVTPQVAWAVGGDNRVVRTQDGGQTWAAPKAMPSVGIPTLASWASVSFVDPRFGFVGGTYGLYKTEDGGDTWTNVPPFSHDNGPPPGDRTALVRFRDYEHGVVVLNFHQEGNRPRDIQILDAANVYVYGGPFGLRRWVAP